MPKAALIITLTKLKMATSRIFCRLFRKPITMAKRMVKKQIKAKVLKSKAFPEEPNITVDNHSAGTNRTKKTIVAAVRHICSTRATTDLAFA